MSRDRDEGKEHQPSRLWVWIVGGGLALVLLGGLCSLALIGWWWLTPHPAGPTVAGASPTQPAPSTPSKSGAPKKTHFEKMELAELTRQWKEAPSACVTKWYKTEDGIEIEGVYESITRNDLNQTGVRMYPPDAVGEEGREVVIYVVEKQARDGLDRCKVGKMVRVKAGSAGITTPYPALYAYAIEPVE